MEVLTLAKSFYLQYNISVQTSSSLCETNPEIKQKILMQSLFRVGNSGSLVFIKDLYIFIYLFIFVHFLEVFKQRIFLYAKQADLMEDVFGVFVFQYIFSNFSHLH